MAVSNEIVSQKFNNYNYAPGIATYGIDGKTGQSGENGNNFYFTDLDLNDSEGLQELVSQIINNRLPLRNSTVELKRKYQNDDLFIDYTGIIYKLNDINNLSTSNTETYKKYFSIAGRINVQDVNNYFDWVGQRLVLNSSYSGYDIITGISSQVASSYIDENAAVNIISGNIDENDNIEMIRMKSIDSIDVEDGDFSLYYKTTENAYYFDSNKPIIINSDLKVQNNNNIENEYDNYSTILTSEDTVTYFKYICDKLRYNVVYDDTKNLYKLVIFSSEENESDQIKTLEYLINRNESVFGKIYSKNNEQILVHINSIGNTTINSSKYYDYGTQYIINTNNIIDISTNNFKIIGEDNASINIPGSYYIIGKSISDKNLVNIDIFESEGNAFYAEANSGNMFDTIYGTILESDTILPEEQDQSGNYGVKFRGALDFPREYHNTYNNYVLIKPLVDIDETYKIEVEMWFDKKPTGTEATGYINMYIDNIYQNNNQYNPTIGEASTYYESYNYSIGKETFDFATMINNRNISYKDPETGQFSRITLISSPIYIGVNHTNTRIKSIKILKKEAENTEFTGYNILRTSSIDVGQVNDVSMYKLVNSEGVFEEFISQKLTRNILCENKNKIHKFTFNISDFNNDKKYIKFNIIPKTTYEGKMPISFILNLDGVLNTVESFNIDKFNIYFETEYEYRHIKIKNIMVSEKDYLQVDNEIEKPCIQTYIPDFVTSVSKVSLMHNTEIFIQNEY